MVNPDICEFHIAGQDGGYGECILAHVGDNDWIIVDSCIDPDSKIPITLKLLSNYQVDSQNVKLIVCTHWHQDHINGLSKVLEKCPNAFFSFARTTDKSKFLRFIEFDYQHKVRFGNSSAKEFKECLEVLNKSDNKKRIIRSSADQALFSKTYKNLNIRISSLSPSYKANTDFEVELTKLLDEKSQSNIKIPYKSPNDKSVVLLLELGNYSILLGADLEVKQNDDYGWLNITRHSRLIPGTRKSTLFKIPHHGSENGYHKEIWENLLEPKPDALITPFSSSNLPNKEYVELYNDLTNSLNFTSTPKISNKAKKRERSVEKLVKDLVPTMREIRSGYGVISCSLDFTKNNSKWSIHYEGEAHMHINQ